MQPKKIVVVGSANMDMVMGVSRLPKPGETLVGNAFMTALGGKGANQAVAAARLGAQVSFVGAVGDDPFGAQQREGLAADNIDLDNLNIHPELPTGAAQILTAASGENMIVVTAGANQAVMPADIMKLTALFTEADVVLSQFEIPRETVLAAMTLARNCNTFSILDAGAVQPGSMEAVACARLVSPNETEAETLTGIPVDSPDTAREAATRIRAMGVEHVVVKLGAKGCLYLGDSEVYAPAFAVKAVDTTAAGDAFTAALGVAWGRLPLADALYFANAAGALAATVAGAQPSMPKCDAVLRFLETQGHPINWQT